MITGGTGDYTKGKYEQSDYTMQEILALKEDASSCSNDSMPDPNRADILSVYVAQQEELRKMVREINVGYLAVNVGVQTVSELNVGTGDNGHNMKDGSMFGDTFLTLSTYDPVIYF